MKNKIICLLLPLFLLGCSKKSAEAPSPPPQSKQSAPTTALPFTVTVVETSETKESHDITNKAVVFLKAKNYDQLDELAAKLRSSKETWATGSLKLGNLYSGLAPSKEASDSEWETRLTALRDWIAAKPTSITAQVALAYFLSDYAWKARGVGWANTVSDEGWRLFNERLLQATEILNHARELKDKCPIYWSVQMRTALGLQIERPAFDTIFNQAITFQPDYEAYYFRRAMYLLPRWHGNDGEWETDLTKSADRIGGENGDEIYAQVVWCIHQSISSTNMFTEYNLSWPRVNKGFGIIEKHFPDSLAAKSEHAHLAALAGDVTTARKCFDLIDGKADLTVWKSQKSFERFAHWAYGR